jgi:aspartate racemase
MKKKGAELFILGCTELPLYFETLGIMEIIADPTDILARCAVKKSGKKVISSAL